MYLDNLKELRNYYFLTQREVSEFLKCKRTTYNNWEQRTVIIPLDIADKLSIYYHVRLSCILGIEEIAFKEQINNMDYDILLKNLNKLKKERKLSYYEIGDYIGCSYATCQRYFNNIIPIPTDRLVLLSELFEVDLDVLCGKVEVSAPAKELVSTK